MDKVERREGGGRMEFNVVEHKQGGKRDAGGWLVYWDNTGCNHCVLCVCVGGGSARREVPRLVISHGGGRHCVGGTGPFLGVVLAGRERTREGERRGGGGGGGSTKGRIDRGSRCILFLLF